MKSLLVSISFALAIVLITVAAGDHHGINITVSKALISTYWLTIPLIIVGFCVDLFSDK